MAHKLILTIGHLPVSAVGIPDNGIKIMHLHIFFQCDFLFATKMRICCIRKHLYCRIVFTMFCKMTFYPLHTRKNFAVIAQFMGKRIIRTIKICLFLHSALFQQLCFCQFLFTMFICCKLIRRYRCLCFLHSLLCPIIGSSDNFYLSFFFLQFLFQFIQSCPGFCFTCIRKVLSQYSDHLSCGFHGTFKPVPLQSTCLHICHSTFQLFFYFFLSLFILSFFFQGRKMQFLLVLQISFLLKKCVPFLVN